MSAVYPGGSADDLAKFSYVFRTEFLGDVCICYLVQGSPGSGVHSIEPLSSRCVLAVSRHAGDNVVLIAMIGKSATLVCGNSSGAVSALSKFLAQCPQSLKSPRRVAQDRGDPDQSAGVVDEWHDGELDRN